LNPLQNAKKASPWIVALALTLGGCDWLFHRAEREMARADAELHRYCRSLSPGTLWSQSVLPHGLRSEGGGGTWLVLGEGVAVCELKVDSGSKLVSAEFRPD
jgi:hypothetical protein